MGDGMRKCDTVTLVIDVFPERSLPSDVGSQVFKVMEEACEVRSAFVELQMEHRLSDEMPHGGDAGVDEAATDLADEIADCVQACVNLASMCGIDLAEALSRVHDKNESRGRL